MEALGIRVAACGRRTTEPSTRVRVIVLCGTILWEKINLHVSFFSLPTLI